VHKVSVDGGPVTLLAASPTSGGSIGIVRLGSGRVYWARDPFVIYSVAATGGAVQTVTSNLAFISDFVVDADNVYFSEEDSGDIRRVPLDAGTPVTISNGLRGSYNVLAQDATNLFLINQVSAERIGKVDGETEFLIPGPLAAEPSFPASIAVDQGHIFWTDPPSQQIQYLTK